MAAPLSPTTTYVPTTTPSIKSADLDDLQKFLYSGIYSGLYSIIALKIDGVGGNAVSPNAAQLVIGQSVLANTPLAVFQDQLGNARSLVDHNGYRVGRFSEFREDWWVPQTLTSGVFSGALTNPIWNAILTANANVQVNTSGNLIGQTGGSAIRVVPGTANTNSGIVCTALQMVNTANAFLAAVFEFEFSPATALANIVWSIGLAATNTPSNLGTLTGGYPSVDGYFFQSTSGGVWNAITRQNTGPNVTAVPSATSPALVTAQRFRIEIYGSASPYGACARYFLNETLVATITTNIPPGSVYFPFIVGNCTGAVTGQAFLGSIHMVVNRWASLPLL